VLTGLLADMLDAGAKGREMAIGLIALMCGALSLSRAVAHTEPLGRTSEMLLLSNYYEISQMS
jgi:hypothetical protein